MIVLLFAAALLAEAASAAAPPAQPPTTVSPAVVPGAAQAKDPMICEDQEVAGTRLRKRVCVLKSQKEARERDVQRFMTEATRVGPAKQP